jgi:hypothetical protein
MACYNSELPIGPQGPTGPQGPPGESGTCCVERIINDNFTTAAEDVNNSQFVNINLTEDGQFVEFNFDAVSGEFITFELSIDSNLLINVSGDPVNNVKGTINITRLSSTQISVTLDVVLYAPNQQYGLLHPSPFVVDLETGLGQSSPYYYNNNYTLDPTSLIVDLVANSSSGESTLKVTKVLKYNIPYL